MCQDPIVGWWDHCWEWCLEPLKPFSEQTRRILLVKWNQQHESNIFQSEERMNGKNQEKKRIEWSEANTYSFIAKLFPTECEFLENTEFINAGNWRRRDISRYKHCTQINLCQCSQYTIYRGVYINECVYTVSGAQLTSQPADEAEKKTGRNSLLSGWTRIFWTHVAFAIEAQKLQREKKLRVLFSVSVHDSINAALNDFQEKSL